VTAVKEIVPENTRLGGYMWDANLSFDTGQYYPGLFGSLDVFSPMIYWQQKGILPEQRQLLYQYARSVMYNSVEKMVSELNGTATRAESIRKLIPCLSVGRWGNLLDGDNIVDYALADWEWKAAQVNVLGALGDEGVSQYDLFFYWDWFATDNSVPVSELTSGFPREIDRAIYLLSDCIKQSESSGRGVVLCGE